MFTGFTPETVDFLWGIRMNNDRDWFLAHKQQYVDSLYEPMKALGQALFQPFADSPGNICKVSRIYRDQRMHPPQPIRRACGCASGRTASGGEKIPACIWRSTLRGWTAASFSGSPKPPPWRIFGSRSRPSPRNFWI